MLTASARVTATENSEVKQGGARAIKDERVIGADVEVIALGKVNRGLNTANA